MTNYDDWLTVLIGLDVIWKLQNDRVWRNTAISPMSAIHIINCRIAKYKDVFNIWFDNCCMFMTTDDVYNRLEVFRSVKDDYDSTQAGTSRQVG